MCLSPITIVNPTKYVSLRYRDRFILQVPCNKCAECQRNRHNEWYYRAYQHSLDYLSKGGFTQFLTLTYDNKHLPHISDYIQTRYNFSCFNSAHLRQFFTSIRSFLRRNYPDVEFSYFAASEYGTSEGYNYKGKWRKATHRPHYHVLFYVVGIDALLFSSIVSRYWKYGRTDGIPYKSAGYVRYNTFDPSKFNENLATIKYVSKYVQKSCLFDSKVEQRLDLIMNDISEKMPDYWLDSVNYQLVRERLKRRVSQFHRQSTQFGASALANIDLNEVFRTGALLLVDQQCYVKSIPLPTYYKRKLFYEQVEIDGAKVWTPTTLGYQYIDYRKKFNYENLRNRFISVCRQVGFDFDCAKLANYVTFIRGRINASMDSTLEQRMSAVDVYNYQTRTDKQHLGKGITTQYLGNVYRGYCVDNINKVPHVNSWQFAQKHCFLDKQLESQLDTIYNYTKNNIEDGKQKAFQLRQRLVNLYHYIFT